MNALSSNPFTGLKAILARLLSGGWMGLVLHVLYRRQINAALTALEGLFAQWQAGTLPPPTTPVADRTAAPAPAAGAPAAAPRARRVRRPLGRSVPVTRRQPVMRMAAAQAGAAAPHGKNVPCPRVPSARALPPSRRRARCTENPNDQPHLCTP